MAIEDTLRGLNPLPLHEAPASDYPEGIAIQNAISIALSEPRASIPRKASRTPKRLLVASALVISAAILAVAGSVVMSPVSSTTAAAATTLRALSNRAGILSTGPTGSDYAYTRIEAPTDFEGISTGRGGVQYYEYLVADVQTWVDGRGAGRRVETINPTPQFMTASARQAWIDAGSPAPPVPPGQLSSVETFAPGSSSADNTLDPLYRVAGLPTAAEALRHVLSNPSSGSTTYGRLPSGIAALDDVSACETANCALFERAARLLEGPDVGSTPALRAGLLRVLSDVQGVQQIGVVRDRTGTQGVEFAYTEHTAGGTTRFVCTSDPSHPVIVPMPATTRTTRVIIDRTTTQLISIETSVSPSYLPHVVDPCSTQRAPTTTNVPNVGPDWVVVVAKGTVSSDTAVPTPAP
jgi:hypothetical protein